MSQDRERALGKFVILKKQIYELSIKAQSMVNVIHEETDSFLSDKDFNSMDFVKIETLAKELQLIQEDYTVKAGHMQHIKETYGF
jgi:hypothetical protein